MVNIVLPDFNKELGYAHFCLYNKFNIRLSISDWDFMCKNRWFSDKPALTDVEAEFGICGAREAQNDKEANTIVQKTIDAYKRIMRQDLLSDCRTLLQPTSKTVAKLDTNGKIYFEEAQD